MSVAIFNTSVLERITFISVISSFISGSLNNSRWNPTGITVLSSPILSLTSGVYLDSQDMLYIVDETANHVIWKLLKNASTPILVTGTVGSSGTNANQLSNPQDVYVDANHNVYVADGYNARVQKYVNGSSNGITIAGMTAINGTVFNQLQKPRYFNFDPSEMYMFVADTENHRIMRFPTNSTSGANGVLVAGGNGPGNNNTQLNYPWGVYYSTASNYLYTTNAGGASVMRWLLGAPSGTCISLILIIAEHKCFARIMKLVFL